MRLLVVIFGCMLAATAFGQAGPAAATIPVPALSARAWLIMDYGTGQILASHEAHTRLEPASLTKVMTTYLVAEALKNRTLAPTQPVIVSERAWRTQGSRSFVPVNKPVLVDDLMKGMVIQSGNDASVALAEAVAGSETAFATMMNATAQRLGLRDSNFLNASGFFDAAEPQHYSTANDLARLAAALMRDYPETHQLHATKEYTYNGIRQHNRNRLLWADSTVDGLKTGHSSAAGYCLIATAQRGPRRLISVVLGTASEDARARDSLNLLNWGFSATEAVRLYSKGHAVSQFKVFKGTLNQVAAGFADDLVVSIPRGKTEAITVQMESRQPLVAPVAKGSVIGTLKLAVDGKPWADYPVVALDEIPVAGLLGRAWDGLKLFFQ